MPARPSEGPFSMHSLDYGFEVGKLKLCLRSSTKEPCPGSTGGLHSHNACIHAHRSKDVSGRGREKGIQMAAHVTKGKVVEEPWEEENDGVLRGTEGQQHSGKGRQMEGPEVNGEGNGMGRGKTGASVCPVRGGRGDLVSSPSGGGCVPQI